MIKDLMPILAWTGNRIESYCILPVLYVVKTKKIMFKLNYVGYVKVFELNHQNYVHLLSSFVVNVQSEINIDHMCLIIDLNF
jgi:hypothetical protein